MKIFLSYRFDQEHREYETIVHRVAYFLNRQKSAKDAKEELTVYCYAGDTKTGEPQALQDLLWRDAVLKGRSCNDYMVAFFNSEWGITQRNEIEAFLSNDQLGARLYIVNFSGAQIPSVGQIPQDNITNSCLNGSFSALITEFRSNLTNIRPSNSQVSEMPNDMVDGICPRIESQIRNTLPPPPLSEPLATKIDKIAYEIAKEVHKKITNGAPWILNMGLPIGYPYDYEKDIIEEFEIGRGELYSRLKQQLGCPLTWPILKQRREETLIDNPIFSLDEPTLASTIGEPRGDQDNIIVDVRTKYHGFHSDIRRCLEDSRLHFLEAGPRKQVIDSGAQKLRVGLVVSGGIAPGINAVISGILKSHIHYWRAFNYDQIKTIGDETLLERDVKLSVYLYCDGLSGILHGGRKRVLENIGNIKKFQNSVGELSNVGGSIVTTARFDELLDIKDPIEREGHIRSLIHQLYEDQIDVLYVIGGEGSMRAAHVLATRIASREEDSQAYSDRWGSDFVSEMRQREITVAAIPKTMDNDILWVWQSFGFLSAVEEAKRLILQLHIEARSNPRVCVVQLFGSDSGFVASHAALASGVCNAALVPEVNYTLKQLSDHMIKHLSFQNTTAKSEPDKIQRPYGVVLLAETAIPQDIEDYIDNSDYTCLKLEEAEKTEIRKFVGSSLLVLEDIYRKEGANSAADTFKRFLRELLSQINENDIDGTDSTTAVRRAIKNALPNDILGIFELDNLREDICEDMAAIVVKTINNYVLRNRAFNTGKDSPNRLLDIKNHNEQDISDIRDFITQIDCMLEKKEGNGIEFIQRMQRISLPHENTVIRKRITRIAEECYREFKKRDETQTNPNNEEKYKQLQRDLWNRILLYLEKDHPGNRKNYQIKRMRDRLVERHNRLCLAMCIPSISRESRFWVGDRRLHGQTPDALRTGCLKVVTSVLQTDIRKKMISEDIFFKNYRVFANEPRHLIRSISPSASDVIFGQRLGNLAVDSTMAGYTDFMVSQWLTEFVLVPLDLVVLGRKRIPKKGIFWKSVVAKTGQLDLSEDVGDGD